MNAEMTRRAELYEYSSMANPAMPLIPVVAHEPSLHRTGPSRVEYFDLSKDLEVRSQGTEFSYFPCVVHLLCTRPIACV